MPFGMVEVYRCSGGTYSFSLGPKLKPGKQPARSRLQDFSIDGAPAHQHEQGGWLLSHSVMEASHLKRMQVIFLSFSAAIHLSIFCHIATAPVTLWVHIYHPLASFYAFVLLCFISSFLLIQTFFVVSFLPASVCPVRTPLRAHI